MKPAHPYRPFAALSAFTGLNLLNYLDRNLLPSLVSPVEKDLGLNDSQFGTVLTAFMAGYFLTSPVFGYLGDRLPRKWLIAAGVAVWSAGTALSGFAHGLVPLVLFRVIVGFGEASYGTISPSWIADLFAPARRNLALSVFYVAIPVGSALGFIVGGSIGAAYGWRNAFLWAGAPGLLLALLLLALPEPARGASEPPGIETEGRPGAARAGYLDLLRYPAYWLVVAGYVAQTFALGGFNGWAAAFLERAHGMRPADADHFFGLSLVATGLVATLLGGAWASAWQRRRPSGYARMIALSAIAGAPAAFAVFMVRDPRLSEAALVSAMFLIFLSTGPVNTLILETVPVAMRASAMAASIFAIHLFGDLWSPKIVGVLSDGFGDLRRAMEWTLPPALVVSALFWGWLAARQSLPRRPEPALAEHDGRRK